MAGGRSDAARGSQFVDFQNDVAASDILLAAREGFESVEHVKRYTAMGRHGSGQARQHQRHGHPGAGPGQVHPRDWHHHLPAELHAGLVRAFAGRELGEFLDPVRKTCLHEWHAGRGALFEDGQLEAALVLPAGEDLHAAVRRECLAVRNGVGILMPTLGKIDIQDRTRWPC